MGEDGFEPPNSEEDRFTVCCRWPLGYSPGLSFCAFAERNIFSRIIRKQVQSNPQRKNFKENDRASGGIRTPDLLITNQ